MSGLRTYQYNDPNGSRFDPGEDTGETRWIAAASEEQARAHARERGWLECGGEIFDERQTRFRMKEPGLGGIDVVLLPPDSKIQPPTAEVLAGALRQLMNYVGGWDEKADHPCGIGRDTLEAYEIGKAVPMPKIDIEKTDEYGRAFKDAVESFILAGADHGMVQTVLDAFDNNAPAPGARP